MVMDIKADTFIDDYLSWLKSNMTEENIDDGIIEITTPFLDFNNDYTQIYVEKKDNNKYRISDLGYVINELNMLGIDINSPKRKKLISTVLNRFGVRIDGEVLNIDSTLNDFPKSKHKLLQTMLALEDLLYTSRPNIVSIFYDEVVNFFEANEIYCMANVSFIGVAGYTHNYDFAIQRSKDKPERLIKLVNNLNKQMTESILFSWNDTRAIREKDSVLYAIINDANRVSDKDLNALESYDVLPIPWSHREDYLNKLA